jgi:hypothetical protein
LLEVLSPFVLGDGGRKINVGVGRERIIAKFQEML